MTTSFPSKVVSTRVWYSKSNPLRKSHALASSSATEACSRRERRRVRLRSKVLLTFHLDLDQPVAFSFFSLMLQGCKKVTKPDNVGLWLSIANAWATFAVTFAS